MGLSAGWEAPLWFATPGSRPAYEPSFVRTNWQLEQGREYELLTRAVGLADLSSFGKFELTGSEARRLLDLATANTVPLAGRTALCHMLTRTGTVRGGPEGGVQIIVRVLQVYSELTVTCLEDDRFLILTGGGSELHDLRRLEDIARAEKLSVKLDNVTERLGTLTVAGPRSRDLMARLTDQVSR